MSGPTNTGVTGKDQNEDERNLNLEEPKKAETAGLSMDDIGLNAKSTAALSDPTRPENHTGAPDSQTITNEQDAADLGYASGHDSSVAQKDQYDTALSGAGDGRHSGTIFDTIEERRRILQDQKNEDFRKRVAMYAAQLNYQQFKDSLDNIAEAQQEREAEAAAAMAAGDESHDALKSRISDLETDLQRERQRLVVEENKLEAMQAHGASDADIQAQQEKIAGMQDTLERGQGQLDAFKTLETDLAQKRQVYVDKAASAREKLNELNKEVEAAGGKITPEMEGRRQELIQAEEQAKAALEGYTNGTKFTVNFIDMMDRNKLAGRPTPPGMDQMAAMMMKAAEDGFVSTEEQDEMQAVMEGNMAERMANMPKPGDPGYDPEKMAAMRAEMKAGREEFMGIVKDSGVAFQNADGDFVSGEDATEYLQSKMKQLREDMRETREEIADVSSDKTDLQQRIADLQAQRGTQQATLDSAQAALDTESAETAEIHADAAGAQAGMMEYNSVYDYMSKNYGYMGMGAGEDVGKLATQMDRMLTDDNGKLVYVDPDTQTMYTLGDTTNSDGNPVKVAVSPEDTADLYRKMFEEKLLPRNFVPDGDGIMGVGAVEGAIKEYSPYDGFGESISKSLIPGSMGKDQFSQVIESSVAAQEAEEAVARAAQAEAQGKVAAARTNVANAQQALDATNGELAKLQRELSDLETEEQNLIAEGEKQNIDLSENAAALAATETGVGSGDANQGTEDLADPALKTSNEMQVGLQDVYRKVDRTSGTGMISRDELEQALGADASPELKAQIEAALERDGIEIKEPDELQNDDNSPDIAGVDLGIDDNIQLASTGMYSAFFPFLGIGPFQVAPIQTPTFQPDPNGVYPAPSYESFADSMEFASTNPKGGPEPTYLDPINNGTKSAPAAGETFGLAMTNQLNRDTAAQGGMTPADALRLREDELRMAENSGMSNQGGGGGFV
tara:strand:- start:152 stop:3031 length:2880 start_codon:yes stop_codon:yes gene_type:complete